MVTKDERILTEEQNQIYDKINKNGQLMDKMLQMSDIPDCRKCECMKMYDYMHKIYYCDHENRADDMGKISVGSLPIISPNWCPKREEKY